MNNLCGFSKHSKIISHSLGNEEEILSYTSEQVPKLIFIYNSCKVFQFHVTSLYISSLAPAPNWPFFGNTFRFTTHSLKRLQVNKFVLSVSLFLFDNPYLTFHKNTHCYLIPTESSFIFILIF